MIPLAQPGTGPPVTHAGDRIVTATGELVGTVRGGVARFVEDDEHYAASFGEQWNRWQDSLSDSRNLHGCKRRLLLDRTGWDPEELAGLTILECGMGAGTKPRRSSRSRSPRCTRST